MKKRVVEIAILTRAFEAPAWFEASGFTFQNKTELLSVPFFLKRDCSILFILFSDFYEKTPNTNSNLFFFLLFPLQPNNNKESLCVTQSASMLAGSCAFPAEVRSGYASFLSGSVPRSPWGTGGGRGEAGGKGVQPARPPHDTLAGTW